MPYKIHVLSVLIHHVQHVLRHFSMKKEKVQQKIYSYWQIISVVYKNSSPSQMENW